MDDFGTGYSSLAYLRRLEIDALKLDRSFMSGVPDDEQACAVAGAVVKLGQSLGLSVVAEGVEHLEQAQWLHQLGCDELQGFYFGKPMLSGDFSAWLDERQAARQAKRLAQQSNAIPKTSGVTA